MKNITTSLVLAPVIMLVFFATAHAQTSASLQAELNALLAQLAALQAQLQTTTGSPSAAPAASGSAYGQCPNLTRTLRQGISGSDVTGLQAFLAADSRIYPEGTISGYFGALTQAAVQRFQVRHGIVNSGTPDSTGYGLVGPTTRATIGAVCRSGAAVPTGTCTLDGITVASGATAEFYSAQNAPSGSMCSSIKQTRQCVNGVFSGSTAYQYKSCGQQSSLNCTLDDTLIANGVSATYYSRSNVSVGQACTSYAQIRTCTNGTLSGSNTFKHTSCTAEIPDSCSLSGTTVAHGQARTFYKQDIATSTNSCSAYGQSRTCNDGTLSGSSEYTKASCTAGVCSVNGQNFANGSTTTFYFAQNVPANEQCSSYAQSRTCSNGTFSGNSAYQYTSCAPVAAGSCVVDNVVLTSGQSRTFYSGASAPAGATCGSVAQSRTCTNGTLSGSATYNRATCADTASCALDGVTVAHGASATFYSARTVPYGTTCSSKAQVRTCTNGMLSGSGTTQTQWDSEQKTNDTNSSTVSTYQYATCSVNPPTSAVQNTSQLAAALAALEAILRDALAKLGF